MTSEGGALRLLLIADEPVVREGLRALLEAAGETVVATEGLATFTTSGYEPSATWDCAIVAIGAESVGERVLAIADALGELPVVFVGSGALLDEVAWGWPRRAGFVAHAGDAGRIAVAARAVMAGFTVYEEPLPAREAAHVSDAGLAILTPREHEVLQLVARGLATKEIARELGLSEHTAKFHVGQILQKLGASSRAEAVMIAARRGLIPL